MSDIRECLTKRRLLEISGREMDDRDYKSASDKILKEMSAVYSKILAGHKKAINAGLTLEKKQMPLSELSQLTEKMKELSTQLEDDTQAVRRWVAYTLARSQNRSF